MAEDLSEKIAANADAPASVSGDTGSMSQHSLPDQIAADRYLKAQQATKNPNAKLGIKLLKISPGGAD